MADPRLRKVSFTGSTGIGKQLVKQAADQLQRVSMELGGNAPFLVFDDADVDAAVDGAMLAKMRNMGEACTAANRFLVHSSVSDEFAKKLADRMGALTLGRGQDDGTDVGPLIDEKAVESVDQAGRRRGRGRRLGRGRRPGARRPRLLLPADGAGRRAPRRRDQPRGDLRPGRADHDVRDRGRGDRAKANDTEYGLSSYVYTRDLKRTIRLAEALDFGMVGVNTGLVSNPAAPFGGVKASGFGREGGFEGIEEYLDTTYVALAVD